MSAKKAVVFVLAALLSLAVATPGYSAEPTKFTVMLRGAPDFNKSITELLQSFFDTYPKDVQLEVLEVPGKEVWQKLQVMTATGVSLDLVHLRTPDAFPAAHDGLIEDLSPRIERSGSFDLNNYYPGVIGSIAYKGDIYALPFAQAGPQVMYYNADRLDAAGVPYPDESWDWNDEMTSYGKRLTVDDNGDGTTDRWAVFPSSLWGGETDATFVKAFGGNKWTEDGHLDMTSSKAQEALHFMISLWNTGIFGNNGGFSQDWGDGTIAMRIGGSFMVRRLRDGSDFRWNAAPPPAINGKRYTTSWAESPFGIPTSSANKDVAWDLLQYLLSPAGQAKVVELGIGMPIHKSVATSPLFLNDTPPDRNVFVQALSYTIPRGGDRSLAWGEVRGDYNATLQQILNGEVSPLEGMTTVEKKLDAALSKY